MVTLGTMEYHQKAFNVCKSQENEYNVKGKRMLLLKAQRAKPATQNSEGSKNASEAEFTLATWASCWPILCVIHGQLISASWGIGEGTQTSRRRWNFDPTCSFLEQLEGATEFMARTRERQPCRRGSGRGTSSRSPVADEHHHCCCSYYHRRAGALPVSANQFMEVGSSSESEAGLPAFGTVVFTLGSTQSNPGINAHISILFTQAPEKNDKGKQEKATGFG